MWVFDLTLGLKSHKAPCALRPLLFRVNVNQFHHPTLMPTPTQRKIESFVSCFRQLLAPCVFTLKTHNNFWAHFERHKPLSLERNALLLHKHVAKAGCRRRQPSVDEKISRSYCKNVLCTLWTVFITSLPIVWEIDMLNIRFFFNALRNLLLEMPRSNLGWESGSLEWVFHGTR
jgi:hypothetical protein